MLSFYSAGNIKNAEKDSILCSLVDAVDSNCVMDRQLVISDLQKHDEAAGEETKFGNVSVHVAMSVGVKSFCIAAGILKDHAEQKKVKNLRFCYHIAQSCMNHI